MDLILYIGYQLDVNINLTYSGVLSIPPITPVIIVGIVSSAALFLLKLSYKLIHIESDIFFQHP